MKSIVMPETNRQGTVAFEFKEWMRREDFHATLMHRRLKLESVLSEARDQDPIGGTGQNLYIPKHLMQFGLSGSIADLCPVWRPHAYFLPMRSRVTLALWPSTDALSLDFIRV